MSTEKMYCMNPEDHWIQNFCLKFLYLGFILINVWNILLHIVKNLSQAKPWRAGLVYSRYSWRIWPVTKPQEKFLIFPLFKFGNSNSRTSTGTKLFYKYGHFFFLKIVNLITYLVLESYKIIKCQEKNYCVALSPPPKMKCYQ